MGRWCVKRASRSVADSSRPATERRSLSDRRHRGGDGALDQLHGLRTVARSEGLQGLIDLAIAGFWSRLLTCPIGTERSSSLVSAISSACCASPVRPAWSGCSDMLG